MTKKQIDELMQEAVRRVEERFYATDKEYYKRLAQERPGRYKAIFVREYHKEKRKLLNELN